MFWWRLGINFIFITGVLACTAVVWLACEGLARFNAHPNFPGLIVILLIGFLAIFLLALGKTVLEQD